MTNNMAFTKGLVSCVTPVYNGAEWLPNLLDSLLAQTYDKVEVILVDDGSTDNTVAIAESYRECFQEKGYGYQLIYAEHRNASSAVNRGLKAVTGEFLIWPDADDRLETDSIARRVGIFSDTSIEAVRSLSYYFDWETKEHVKADEKRGDLENQNLFFPILESQTFVCCGCYMLRSELFFQIYPEREIPIYDVGQNFQMLLPYMYRHTCVTIQEELYGVCVHVHSHSRRRLTKQQEVKKYRDYESMLKEIVRIANIEDKADLRRIAIWKARRRMSLARKHRLPIWKLSGFLWRLRLGDI